MWSRSAVQAIVENLLKEYPNVLTLRVRMPIVADLVYPRNFIAKIIKYEKVRRAVVLLPSSHHIRWQDHRRGAARATRARGGGGAWWWQWWSLADSPCSSCCCRAEATTSYYMRSLPVTTIATTTHHLRGARAAPLRTLMICGDMPMNHMFALIDIMPCSPS